MIKLPVSETKWSSLLARTCAHILYISIWIFDFGPVKLTGLSRNGSQEWDRRDGCIPGLFAGLHVLEQFASIVLALTASILLLLVCLRCIFCIYIFLWKILTYCFHQSLLSTFLIVALTFFHLLIQFFFNLTKSVASGLGSVDRDIWLTEHCVFYPHKEPIVVYKINFEWFNFIFGKLSFLLISPI